MCLCVYLPDLYVYLYVCKIAFESYVLWMIIQSCHNVNMCVCVDYTGVGCYVVFLYIVFCFVILSAS